MAPSGQSTTITHPPLTWKEQLSLLRGTTFCVPHPDRGQKAQQKQRRSSSKPVNTVQVGPRAVVAGRGACRQEDHARPPLGSAGNPAPRPARPEDELGLHLRSDLPATG